MPKADKLGEKFYEVLFERYPGVRPLFVHSRIPEQRQRLIRSIAIIVRHLEDMNYLKAYLHGLGKMHVAYGAKDEYYDAVGECLIAAMKDIAGPCLDE